MQRLARGLTGKMPVQCYSDRTTVLFVFLVAFLLLVSPIFMCSVPPFVDLPNHLARHYIESVLNGYPNQSGAGYLRRYYDFEWRAIPYLASDALYVPLTRIFSIFNAERVALVIIILLWLAAPIALYRALWGEYSVWPLLSALVVYNGNLSWGFEDYVLSVPLAILAFCIWIAWARNVTAFRLVVFSIVATVVYFAHLVAFGLLGLLVASFEMGYIFQTGQASLKRMVGRLFICGLPFAIGAVLFVYLIVEAPVGNGSFITFFGNIADRLQVLFSPTQEFGGQATHIVCGLTLIFLVLLPYGAIGGRRWLKMAPIMPAVLLAVGGLAVIMPTKLFGVFEMQIRLPVVFVVLCICATRCDDVPKGVAWATFTLASSLLVAGAVIRIENWRVHDAEVGQIVTAFKKLERGARLLVAWNPSVQILTHTHDASYAVIERQVFLPNLFTGVTTLRVRPAFRRLDAPAPAPVPVSLLVEACESKRNRSHKDGNNSHAYWRTWWKDYSNVLVLSRSQRKNPVPDLLKPLYKGAFFTLYKSKGFVRQSGAKWPSIIE